MGRIKRRERLQCRLKCEIVTNGRRRKRGRIVSISDGGMALVADLALEQGDPIRLEIDRGPHRPPIKLSAIVWYGNQASPSGRRPSVRKLGCVVSEPSRAYLALLDELKPKQRPRFAVPIPVARPSRAVPDQVEPDLPRSRELQPPPKAEADENLPYFRIRMKQIGGPRTRVLTLRARSATQAESLALDELDRVCADAAAGWCVLHITRVSS